ncbi:MAG: fumarylacetoacetate hydrolase family protein [Rhodospirillaceae bacterium]|jgi:2-keto-4-pentenoate hydratase/2-oxohepta-3-ene-1,7-dioic acid hydratase in catechol pathway|nr:fumarylacetoacetate hydrolase family protein [Rhodospirillaceae bacterium]MBT5038709.1 fumarylacetoacetate hydrolase family protein [Rhodospirillaceae bacterium]MBT5674463.1 fumarylacetoacetate hydrolase family protein [Rhodospirillaceae bacterium]MBT5780591.1 fumarylacetoacetate hydrolase family protein [Rhodospirillaceae bacterium]MBT6830559.1 fumarylacetoacetate hydrolase family protein [Rhodospirillaceae bacterium]
MKLVSYELAGAVRLGRIDPEAGKIYPLGDSETAYGNDMVALIERHPVLNTALPTEDSGVALDQVKILAPIPSPRKNIFCVGKNYFEHAQEFTQSGFDATSKRGDNVPDNPIIFTKAPTTVIAPGDDVPLHAEQSTQMDYEAELAVIIGTGGRGISKAAAFDHVFGYTIANDVTARDLQLKHRQWFIGKSLDGTCPMGPYIATADEIDAENLTIQCWVNGELRQDANSRDLIFDIPTLIETLSAGITLEPGDIISTGTPAGVGIGFDPPRFLAPGDVVKIEIEGLGILENTIA